MIIHTDVACLCDLSGLVSMNGCTDCPFVSQLVDVFQAMSVHLDDVCLRPHKLLVISYQ